jgi:hypothetical protein
MLYPLFLSWPLLQIICFRSNGRIFRKRGQERKRGMSLDKNIVNFIGCLCGLWRRDVCRAYVAGGGDPLRTLRTLRETKKGDPEGRPFCCYLALPNQFGARAALSKTRYCSLPTKPNLVMPLLLTTAKALSTASYTAAGSGWNWSSGSGVIDFV